MNIPIWMADPVIYPDKEITSEIAQFNNGSENENDQLINHSQSSGT